MIRLCLYGSQKNIPKVTGNCQAGINKKQKHMSGQLFQGYLPDSSKYKLAD